MRRLPWREFALIGVLALTVVWLSTEIWELGDKARVAMREAGETENQYRELTGRKSALEGDLALLATARGQDAAIREAFGVAKVGEGVIVVVPPPPATTTPEKRWWQGLLDWLF